MSQHDFNIANGAGAVVRADLNAALEAIITNSSGATEPSTPYANMWWYDTSTATLKRRNNANDAWIIMGLEAADIDGTLAANSDSKVPTQKAVKTYVDAKTIAENRLSIADNTTANASTSAHGFLKKLSNVATEFMNGVGNWVAVTIDALLPTQTGNSGKFLTTNGSVASWATADSQNVSSYAAGTDITIADMSATINLATMSAYTKIKECRVERSGVVSTTFSMKGGEGDAQYVAYGRLYINGVAVGTERSTYTQAYQVYTENITVAKGDLVQLYAKSPNHQSQSVKDFYVKRAYTENVTLNMAG
jgi:hypothetical protein